MKNISLVFFAVFALVILNISEPPQSTAILLFVGLVLSAAWSKISDMVLMWEYAAKIENIYVLPTNEQTGEAIEHDALNKFIVSVPWNQVAKEVENQKRLLARSGNEHFNDDALTENQKIKVRGYVFQSGKRINETWAEFEEFVINDIKKDRIERHCILEEADPKWYAKFSDNQDGIDWA